MLGKDLEKLKIVTGYTSNLQLANALGIAPSSLYAYKAKPNETVPKYVAMAAAAVVARLRPYSGEPSF
jgi:hypothetical protein